jgi:hypothetical protein
MRLLTISSPLAAAMLCLGGCQSRSPESAPAHATAAPAVSAALAPVPDDRPVVRINAGASEPVTDSQGQVWLPDQGFSGGGVIERPGLEIAGTRDPVIYRSEHYSMGAFSWKLPDGPYLVKLHFAETYEDIYGPGERVFSFSVPGREFKDFDVWKAAGGPQRPYVLTVPVTITNGLLEIHFVAQVENPQVNGIEIIPVQ